MISRIAAAAFLLLAIALDQVTKLHCEETFLHSASTAARRVPSLLLFSLGVPPLQVRLGAAHPDSVTPSWLAIELTHVTNRGITLGLLESAPPTVPIAAFYTTTLLGVLVSIIVLARTQQWRSLAPAGALLLLTGVLANLVDRLRIGYVIDWLVIAWRFFAWEVELPAFNLGDTYIASGITLLAAALIVRWRQRATPRASYAK